MIKRYGLGANPDAFTPNSMRSSLVQVVEREDGDYVRYEDYMQIIDAIGAGGVSGRVVKKTIQQQYAEFKEWCEGNRHLDLDSRLHTHSGPIGKGGYISDEKTRAAFAAWRAARDITE